MADDKMDLLMRIKARGDQAMRVLRDLQHRTDKFLERLALVGTVSRGVFRALGRAAQLAMAPIKILAGIGLGLALTFGAMAGKSLGAAGDIEALKLRLEGVTSSAEQANQVFKETLRLSVFSPFKPEELIDARIGLLNIGQTGKAAITTLGDAAAITQRPLGDLVSVLASLETEPLRRIGVEVKNEAGKYEFVFRDKMQNVRRIVANGIDEARKSLLSIFEIKYGGGMNRFASAWKGLISTLQGNIRLALGQFGEGMMPAAKRFVDGLNTKLTTLIESGQLQEMGAALAAKLEYAFLYGKTVFEHAKAILDSMSTEDMTKGLKTVMLAAGQMLAVSIVTYLGAMGSIFKGFGKILASAFLEDIYRSGIPGTGAARRSAAMSAARNAADAGNTKLFESIDPFYRLRISKLMDEGYTKRQAAGMWALRLSNESQVKLAASGATEMFQSGIDEFRKVIPQLGGSVDGALTEIARTALASLQRPGVQPFSERLAANVEQAAAERSAPGDVEAFDRVSAARLRRTTTGRTYWEKKEFYAPHGQYSEGQKFQGGGQVFHINTLTVRADRVRDLQNELLSHGLMPATSAAGM